VAHENVELLRRINQALNGGNFERLFAPADPPPEFEFVPLRGIFLFDLAGVPWGHEGFRPLVEGSGANSTTPILAPRVHRRGRSSVHLGHLPGPWKAERRADERDVWAVWTVLDGRVVRWQGFADREATLDAVDLGE
jgi:hypothetical protein